MTTLIILVTIFVFILQLVIPGLTETLGLRAPAIRDGQIWRLVTHMLAHSDQSVFHILLNMFVLFMFGRMIEQSIGPRHYIALYMVSGISGGLLWLLFNWNPVVTEMGPYHPLLVGASGGVMGILAATAYLFPHERVMLLIPPIPMKLRTMVICIIIVEVGMELMRTSTGIAHLAHLGGIAAGFLYIHLFWKRRGFVRHGPSRTTSFGPSPPAVRAGTLRNLFGGNSAKSREAHAPDLRWAPPPELSSPRGESDEVVDEREVDRILDKIGREGIRSLSNDERRVLKRASEREKRKL